MLAWIESGVQQGAELVLFPELNVTGYIHHSIARQFAETIPGPSTEQAIHVMSIVKACWTNGYFAQRSPQPSQLPGARELRLDLYPWSDG
jgi:predicted amidohydrolase